MKPKRYNRKPMTHYLDVDLLDRVKRYADQHSHKINAVIEMALREFFARKEADAQ
jgi:hypothetical protein